MNGYYKEIQLRPKQSLKSTDEEQLQQETVKVPCQVSLFYFISDRYFRGITLLALLCVPMANHSTVPDFGLQGTAIVRMHGVGGRTVQKLIAFDLHVLRDFSPDIVLLELGTSDLASGAPEVVGSQIEELVQLLTTEYSVRLVIWCQVTPRATFKHHAHHNAKLNGKAALLNQYTRVVLEPLSQAICWKHQGFSTPAVSPFLSDGVHYNLSGQYALYRTYRGAILHALRML